VSYNSYCMTDNQPSNNQVPKPFQGNETLIKDLNTYPDSGGRSDDLISEVVDNTSSEPAPSSGGGDDSK